MTVPYSLDLTTAQQDARNVIAKLKSAGVTSVILAGDPVFPTFLTKEATAQDYFPEWVVLGYAFTDTAVFGRQYDQKQWAHAFGVSLLPARTADDVDELANLITWQTGQPPAAKTFRELVQAPLMFFTGVHLAGPRPHRQDVPRRARSASRPAPTTTPTRAAPLVGTPRHLEGRRPHRRRRRHRRSGGTRTRRAPTRSAHDGKGLYRYADGGKRYLPGQWPTTPVGLFDPKTSITVLTTLPPADAPPSYPSPAP